jgi:hypothetical protein
MIGAFVISRAEFCWSNIVAGRWFFGECFEVANTFKNSTISNDDTVSKDQWICIVFRPNKRDHVLDDTHDDVWVLMCIIAVANIAGKGLVIEHVCSWSGTECRCQ